MAAHSIGAHPQDVSLIQESSDSLQRGTLACSHASVWREPVSTPELSRCQARSPIAGGRPAEQCGGWGGDSASGTVWHTVSRRQAASPPELHSRHLVLPKEPSQKQPTCRDWEGGAAGSIGTGGLRGNQSALMPSLASCQPYTPCGSFSRHEPPSHPNGSPAARL